MNCSEISYSLYFDFSKAFDKLRHSILVYELSLFGIGGNLLRLLDCYLSDRYQCVKVKGSYSTWQLITSGLPQGSIFGPLLFIAFINDFALCLSSSVFMFADDSKALNIDPCILQSDIEACLLWAEENSTEFNASKTELLIIGGMSNNTTNLKFNDIVFSPVPLVKDLGLTFRHNLK